MFLGLKTTLLGPLEIAILSHWVVHISITTYIRRPKNVKRVFWLTVGGMLNLFPALPSCLPFNLPAFLRTGGVFDCSVTCMIFQLSG